MTTKRGTAVSTSAADVIAEERRGDVIASSVADLAPELVALSTDLYHHPELGYREFRTAGVIADLVRRHGGEIEIGSYGIPTAFEATLGDRSHGPRVILTAEYDALPGVGHGCGHNVIAASSVGAFLALARLPKGSFPGSVTLLGTPAEEGGGGKELLIQAGAFVGADASLQIHPGAVDVAASDSSVGKRQVVATFRGRTAHASAGAHLGRNALDAAVTAYQAIAQLRQHIVGTDRVHGVFLEGGTRPNVVPERAVLEFFLRSATAQTLKDLSDRIEPAFRGAALTAGVEVDVIWDGEPPYLPIRINEVLAHRYAEHLAGSREVTPVVRGVTTVASSDVGNVSQVVPALQPSVRIGEPTIPGHSRERADSTQTPDGELAITDSARGLAALALDILTDDDLRAAAWADFHGNGPAITVPGIFGAAPWPPFPPDPGVATSAPVTSVPVTLEEESA